MSELTPEERIARLRAQRGQPSAPAGVPTSSAAPRSVLPPPTAPAATPAAPFPPPFGPAGFPSTRTLPAAVVAASATGSALEEAPRRAGGILRRKPHPARKARWAIGIAAVGGFVAMHPAIGPLSVNADARA